MPTPLSEMPFERASQLVLHPVHRDVYPVLVQLITDLRQCRTDADYYEFQQELLTRVLEVQAHRGECTRVAKRLRRSRAVPADAPELRSGADVNDPESWELEGDVCERVDRQLRSIGDAMAWRLFSYNRRIIHALSRNDPSGPMAGKKGLLAERTFLAQRWHDDGDFALLHDLTSCLRIGDATLFKVDGSDFEAFLHEIKTNAKRRRAGQLRRIKLAEDSVRDGGPLADDPESQLVDLAIPYKTHLSSLRDAFAHARVRGVQSVKVSGGLAIVAADIQRGYALWSEEDFLARTDIDHRRAQKRAGILNKGHHVTFRSDDLAARSPVMPPWAIYPLPPLTCAGLIADAVMYIVTISSESLLTAFDDAGIRAVWALPPGLEQLQPGQVVLNAQKNGRTIQMKQAELRRVSLELADLPTWVKGVESLFELTNLGEHPWPNFMDEWKVWI